eukprot:COSAG01_NODE_24978_length_759_cov_2.557576_1_plen_43_part_10
MGYTCVTSVFVGNTTSLAGPSVADVATRGGPGDLFATSSESHD